MIRAFLQSFGYLLILALIWGSSFILMKKGMGIDAQATFSSWQVASIRLVTAMLFFLPFVYKSRHLLFNRDTPWFLVVGFLGNGIPAYLFTYAETGISSSMAGMLNSLTPLFTLIVAILVFRMAFKPLQMLGILIGMSGAALLVFRNNGSEQNSLFHAAMVVIATVLYAFSVNTIRHKLAHVHSVSIAAIAVFYVGIPALIMMLFQAPWEVMSVPGAGLSLLAIIGLGVFGTAISLLFWNDLVKRRGAVFSTSVTYLIPFVAAFWGWLDGEQFGWSAIMAAVLVLAGIAVVNYAGPAKERN
jgi:drug/metabolite transporter (DMT)-like permease